jgi:predicted O-linked N-acetylglucosamine transferase (SPINDLY family)
MRARMLMPERKQCFKSLAGKFMSIQHIVQTWPQVISLVPKIEGIFGCFKSDEVKDAVKEWLNGLAAEVYDEVKRKAVPLHAMEALD